MSKNVKLMLDGETKTYTGVSTVQIPTTNGGTAEFKDVDEIVTPSGDKNITANGTYDVSAFAQVVVNVPTGGTAPVLQTKDVTITENGTTQIIPDDGNDGMTAVNVTVDVPASDDVGFKTFTTTSTGVANSIIVEGVDLSDAKMLIIEFKAQTTKSPVESGYVTYGGLLLWVGGYADKFALAESMRTAVTSQGDDTFNRNVSMNNMYGIINSSYFNGATFGSNFKISSMERTPSKTTIATQCLISADVVYDVIVHYN